MGIKAIFILTPIILLALVLTCGCSQPAPEITAGTALVTDHIGIFPPPKEDVLFVIIPITIENPADSAPITIDDKHFRLAAIGPGGSDVMQEAENDDWYKSFGGFLYDDELSPIEYGTLQPGESVSGDVLFIALKDKAEPFGISVTDDNGDVIGKTKINDYTEDFSGSVKSATQSPTPAETPDPTQPYIEVKSAKMVSRINNNTLNHLNEGYDKYLVLDVVAYNPADSASTFSLSEETILLRSESKSPVIYYHPDVPTKMDIGLKKPLDGWIFAGQKLSGEMVYEVSDNQTYKYVRLNPPGADYGYFEIPAIICQDEY